MTQICTKCLQEKDETAFAWRKDANKYRTVCRDCDRERKRAYAAAHRTDIQEKRRHYYQEHGERLRTKQRAYHATHADERRAYETRNRARITARQRAHRQAHATAVLERERQYRAKHRAERAIKKRLYAVSHRDALDAAGRIWRQRNRERNIVKLRAWKAANPDASRQYKARRRALKRGASASVNIRHLDIAIRDQWTCHICHRKVTRAEWSLDHLIPLSKGGTHTPENVALAHQECNTRRGVGRLIPAQLRLLP